MAAPDPFSTPVSSVTSPIDHSTLNDQSFWWNLANSNPDPIFVKNQRHDWVFVNDAFCKFVGRDRVEILKQTGSDDLFLPDSRHIREGDETVLATGQAIESQEYLEHSSGKTYLVTIRKSRFYDASGQPFLLGSICNSLFQAALPTEAHSSLINQTALWQAKQRLTALTQHTPLAIIEWDTQLRIQSWNTAAAHIFGYSDQEALQQPLDFLITPHTSPSAKITSAKQFLTPLGGPWSIHESKTKNGRIIIGEWYNSFLTTTEGEVTGILTVVLDVTERKQAEEALATNRALIGAIPDLLLRARGDGTYLNIFSTNNFQVYDGEKLLPGSNIRDSLPPDLAENLLHNIQNVLRTGEPALYEQQVWINQKLQYEEVRITVIGEDDVLIIVRDISARRQAEEAMRETESRFRQLAENIQGYFWLLAENGQYLYVSPGYEQIWGHAAEDLYLDANDWLEVIHPDDRGRVLAADRHQWSSGGYDIEYRMVRPDGETRWIRDRAFPVRDTDGRIYRMAGIADDITDRKQAEEALRASESQLRQKSEALENALVELQHTQAQMIHGEKMSSLGQLVAGIAHEINNPVNFIYGNIAPAKDYISDLLHLIRLYQETYPQPASSIQAEIQAIDLEFLMDDLPKLLASMKMGADRIRQIVLSLRTFSRLDEAEFKATDIHQGIDSTLVILENRLRDQCDRPAIQVIKNYGQLPLVECYAGQLNQVFMNILSNAIDALEERDKNRTFAEIQQSPSSIQIQTNVVGDRIAIHITDNGPGMTEATQRRIFDPFFTTKPVGKGTGIGMSISYQIIQEKHGGTLKCYSVADQGTEFIVEIPIKGKLNLPS